jgi:hypothetical protein
MNQREALELALEGLVGSRTFLKSDTPVEIWTMNTKAVSACVEALAQQDPVIDKSAAIRIATSLGWEPKRTWVGLADVEWMNIVNKDQAWFGQRPDEVAHEVSKLVEAKLKEKNT